MFHEKKKKQNTGEIAKKGGTLTVCRFKSELSEKEGVVFMQPWRSVTFSKVNSLFKVESWTD